MVDYRNPDISYFDQEKCPITGTHFNPSVVITGTGMQVVLRPSRNDDQPRIEEVNGRRVLQRKWWRRNVVTELSVGDEITVKLPTGDKMNDFVAEIRFTFRWSDML